jgi:broad specificity phosphatase PhoE
VGQVLLVRHGQASWGSDDYDVLSETGWAQSRALGEDLRERGVEPALVVHGTMRRHRETAEGAGLAAGATVDAGWDEFDHLGMLAAVPSPFEGREPTRAEFQTWFEAATDRWTGGEHDPDYGEPFAAFGDRVAAALRRTADAAEQAGGSGTAIVFTSGGPTSWATASLLGAELDGPARVRLWRRLNPVVVNSAMTRVVSGRRGLTLVSFNEHGHLDRTPSLLTYR